MRKIFFTAVLAIGSLVSANAQVTNTTQPCCLSKVDFDLKVTIQPIICLWPESQPTGYVEYDCKTDFAERQQFLQSNGTDDDWNLNVWSNKQFDVSVYTDDDNFEYISGPGQNALLDAQNIEWTVKNTATPGLTSFVNTKGTYNTLPHAASEAIGRALDNVISNHSPTYGQFELQFRMKALTTTPWLYAPGLYKADVYVTATQD